MDFIAAVLIWIFFEVGWIHPIFKKRMAKVALGLLIAVAIITVIVASWVYVFQFWNGEWRGRET